MRLPGLAKSFLQMRTCGEVRHFKDDVLVAVAVEVRHGETTAVFGHVQSEHRRAVLEATRRPLDEKALPLVAGPGAAAANQAMDCLPRLLVA
jgi:hypothetical protein